MMVSRKKHFPKVIIVIVNYNGGALLEMCLRSIFDKTDYNDFQVIAVDNGSSDNSVDLVKKIFPAVDLILNRSNLGFARGNNEGIKLSLRKGANYILLLNNDVEVLEPDWLSRLIEVAEAHPNIGIVGPKLLFPNGRIQSAGGIMLVDGPRIRGYSENDYGQYDRDSYIDHVSGAAFLIKREVILKVGLFDESFSPLYFEEAEYCLRARKAGYETLYTHKAVLIHHMGRTISRMPFVACYSFQKNKLLFQLAHYPLRWLLRSIPYQTGALLSSFIGIGNGGYIHVRENGATRLLLILKAYWTNLTSIRTILRRRRLFGTIVENEVEKVTQNLDIPRENLRDIQSIW